MDRKRMLETRPFVFLSGVTGVICGLILADTLNKLAARVCLTASPEIVAGHFLTGALVINEILLGRLIAFFQKGTTEMTSQVSSLRYRQSVILRLSVAFLLLLGTFASVGAAIVPSNRCKDRCNDAYRLRKELCRAIPLKNERKTCEKAAKRAKDNCKHRCR
ncbi:MAG TPA: hypothetical protein DC047_16675 [Blastocatellia bacterium]|nr:hypothetical protein [Blastocatellia bacterium]